MFLNVWNKEICQNQVLFLSFFFCPARYVEVFPRQNVQSILKEGVHYTEVSAVNYPLNVRTMKTFSMVWY